MRIAYLDCFSGISGDMFLGALVDAGVPLKLLQETVSALNTAAHLDARLEMKRVDRSGISASKVDVWIGDEKDEPWVEHDHPEHRHGHTHQHAHEAVLGHIHDDAPVVAQPSSLAKNRVAQPSTAVQEDGNHHAHRGLKQIRQIITQANISESAKKTAIAMFEALGAAEAKVHNIDIENVHFHEVGAADAIVDIVCAAVGSEALGVSEWVCSPLNLGSGMAQCAHGNFPVPAPATAELLKDAPVFSSGIQAELVTPTGAAIAKTLATSFASLPGMKISKIGYGAGTRDFPGHANVMRLLIGETGASESHDRDLLAITEPQETITILEANLDDLNPQIFGYVMDRALAEGALEVFGTPVQMKKNRPGMLLTVLAKPADASGLAKLIFLETSTLGIRMRLEKRLALLRRSIPVRTQWGAVRMKVASLNGAIAHYAPEYEDCRRIAVEHQIPLKQVMQEALRAYDAGAENAEQSRRRA